MNNILQAIQEIEDSVYHESLKPNISTKSKAVALVALQEKLERESGCDWCKDKEDEETIYIHESCDGGYIV